MVRPTIARKKEEVNELTKKLKKAISFYLVDFTGLSANEMNNLRRRFKNSNFEYFVIKNTILKLASSKLGFEEVSKIIAGPNAISISYKDPVGPAKIIRDFSKERDIPTIKLSYIEGRWFSSEEVKKIANLPSKEVLISQVLNLINSPINQFVGLLRNILCNFLMVVNEIREEKAKQTKNVNT